MQAWHVLVPNIRSLEEAAVVDLICFCSTKHSLQEFLDIKNNFLEASVLFLSKKYGALRVEKNEIWVEHAGQKQNKQLTVGATVCFNGCQQMFGCKTRHVATLFVLCPRLDASDAIVVCRFQYIFLGVIQEGHLYEKK